MGDVVENILVDARTERGVVAEWLDICSAGVDTPALIAELLVDSVADSRNVFALIHRLKQDMVSFCAQLPGTAKTKRKRELGKAAY